MFGKLCGDYYEVFVTATQLHSTKSERSFCAGLNPVHGVNKCSLASIFKLILEPAVLKFNLPLGW